MCNGANIVSQITGTTDTSANDDARLVFYTRKTGDSSPSKKLTINSTGGLQIFTNTGTHPNVSAFESNHTGSFTSAGMVLNTPAYSEYHYTWSGTGNYTIDLKCGSYFHSEVIYTQHQTNGGNDMQNYARMKWANNHQTHTGYMYEFSGQGSNAAVTTTFRVSDQNGVGIFDPKSGLTAAGSPGATFRGQYGGGQETYVSNSAANGRLRISETYNGSGLSASSRCLIVRVYFGSFTITKS